MIEGVVRAELILAPRSPARIKRAFDFLFAMVAILLLLPLLTGLAIAIMLESPGNPIFAQERVGLNGKRFRMFKLRTMVPDAERRRAEIEHLNEMQFPMFKVRKDPRITRVGRVLRATSLDELPQLLNVVTGDMSLVGPRPPLPKEALAYTSTQALRLTVPPGLTGMWQVSGRADTTFDDCVRLDLQYIEHWSFWLDLRLIAQTFRVVVQGRGAY
jgi:lipopolysaccharide/colanic/teichoic acid biosynthesis glycosyltransferase